MKRYIFVLVMLFCCAGVAAQKSPKKEKDPYSKEEGSHKALFGVYFGPTVDWFAPTTNALKNKAPKAGLIAGAIVDVNLVPKDILYFTTGVLARYLQGDVSFLNNYQFDFKNVSVNDTVNAVRTYQTTYITIPTGVKFRTIPLNNCVFVGKLGLYHNFRIAGKQFDSFSISGDNAYAITTKKAKNGDAALFAESAYVGLGFEYVFQPNLRVFANFDYSCQFNYFNSKATSNISTARFKTIVHSLHITLGVLF